MIRIQLDYSFQLFNADKWRKVLDDLVGVVARSDFHAFEGIVRELISRLEQQPEPVADDDYPLFCRYAYTTFEPNELVASKQIAGEILNSTLQELSVLKGGGLSSLSRLCDVIDMYVRYKALEGFRDYWFCNYDFVVSEDLWPEMKGLVETAHDRDNQSGLMRLAASFMSMIVRVRGYPSRILHYRFLCDLTTGV